MRYLFAILALSTAAVRATSSDLSDGDKVASDHVVISSGIFKYAAKDHPEPDADGKIVGTGDIGKSVFTSTGAYIAGTGSNPDPKRSYDIIRPSHATAQGLQAKADAGTLTKDGAPLPAGHVSIGIPKGHETTVDEMNDKMKALQANAVRGKGETHANQIVAKANVQPTRPLAEIKAEVDRENKPVPPAKQPKKPKERKPPKEDKSSGGTVESPTAGDGTTNCKRDGSFCTLGNRPKKTTTTGKNAASTVARKTAGNPKSRKAVTDAATAASKKPTRGLKTRLMSSKENATTSKKPVKGSTSTPAGRKQDITRSSVAGKTAGTKKTSIGKTTDGKKASRKQSTGSKKPSGAGKGPSTKKAGTTKKASASGKGASSTKATTTKNPATGKKVSITKKPVSMAGTKSTTRQKIVAKPAAGSSKKQTFTAPLASKKLSSSVVGNIAKSAAPVAKSTKKRINRRELTMNRPRLVYEAVQEYKRSLMQDSVLDELD